MLCPSCQQDVDDAAVICPACDYILDTSFLGDDITDDRPARDPAFGGDALILGDVTNDYAEVFNEETGSYLAAATNAAVRPVGQAPLYVDASTAQLTAPEAILGRRDVPAPPLTPFEEHVLSFFDGERSVEEAQRHSGLSVEDVRIAICMLHEKGLVGLRAEAYDDADETELEAKVPAALLAERGLLDLSSEDEDDAPPVSLVERSAAKTAAPPPVPSGPPTAPPVADDEPPTQQVPSLHTEAEPRTVASVAPRRARPSRAPAPPRAQVSAVDRVKARGVFDLAKKDIDAGRLARAKMYAKLAATLDPSERTYRELLDSWDKAVAAAPASSRPGQGGRPGTAAAHEGLSEDVRLFKQAEEAEAAGDYRKAVSLLREAIQKNPDEGALHNRLGVVLATRLKDFTGAMSALFVANELEPDNENFKHNLAKVLAAAEGKSTVGDIDVDELLTGTGGFDVKKAEAIGKRKNPWAAFKKKLY